MRRHIDTAEDLREQLQLEKDRVAQGQRALEIKDNETAMIKRDYDDTLGKKNLEIENMRRAYEESSYENENLRRIVTAKQDEIDQLNREIMNLGNTID